jgi:hypothetical protein
MCSFDIENMYTNIPKTEVVNIIKNVIENNPGTMNQKEVIDTLRIIL